MAPRVFPISILLILFFAFTSCVNTHTGVATTLASVSASSTTDPPAPTSAAYTTTEVYTPFAICATGGGDWYIDPPTATQLVDLFCNQAYEPGALPPQGEEFDLNEYPTDLISLTENGADTHTEADITDTLNSLSNNNNANITLHLMETTPNYTLTELSGIILALRLVRWRPTVVDNVTYMSGSQAQCDQDVRQDQCHAGLHRVIDQCQWNSHYFGGVNFWMTACAMYSVQVANCSGNWLDPNCDLWHRKWPGVGSGPDPAFPITTTNAGAADMGTALISVPTTRVWRA
ncbi:hypothetical protein AYL99_00097 [Fonsecaea erecta]|uniref:Uncharacterized protein n=1 Tax=Fonsecaea erecta TaxID=1367422 RepID=A0A178ZYM4_9EURO|nr:hypothetical protein AYL99_00097 [Fonsecaea erecta]OAP64125.1 hypothetical protein AYL99_00097 [Fonsecaea erecta]